MIPIIIMFACLVAPTLLLLARYDYIGIPRRTQSDGETSSGFSPLRPESDTPEAIRKHRRQTQRYLMDMWEQRFEIETGANLLREEYARAILAVKREELALFYSNRLMTTRYSLNGYQESMDADIEPYKQELLASRRHAADVLDAYNKALGRPENAAIPTYAYQQFST